MEGQGVKNARDLTGYFVKEYKERVMNGTNVKDHVNAHEQILEAGKGNWHKHEEEKKEEKDWKKISCKILFNKKAS